MNSLLKNFDLDSVASPSFVVFEELLENNLRELKTVMDEAGCKILLALKCFSMPASFDSINKVLQGVCASGSHEARLGKEKFGKEVHVYSPAFSVTDLEESAKFGDHLVFNSINQLHRFRDKAMDINPNLKIGLRCNPEHSETALQIYDPCAPGSRLGVTIDELRGLELPGVSGLHLHTLCEKGADAFKRTLEVFEKKFGPWLPHIQWINFGGGHHITSEGYNKKELIDTLKGFKERYPHLQIYLEPGEAVALNAGLLTATVLDIHKNGLTTNALLDVSAVCHMVDVIEAPYRPQLLNSGMPGEKPYSYTLGGNSCLAGDIIGDYSFDKPLEIGQRLAFLDMAIYSMVKTNTFNGIKLPSIQYVRSSGQKESVRQFGYEDFLMRL